MRMLFRVRALAFYYVFLSVFVCICVDARLHTVNNRIIRGGRGF